MDAIQLHWQRLRIGLNFQALQQRRSPFRKISGYAALHHIDDLTFDQLLTFHRAMLAIEKYIDYYTNKRVQRNLGVLTPLEFHEQKLKNVA